MWKQVCAKGGDILKNGKKPTVAQCEIIKNHKRPGVPMNPKNWLVVKNLPNKMVIRHRDTLVVHEISIERG